MSIIMKEKPGFLLLCGGWSYIKIDMAKVVFASENEGANNKIHTRTRTLLLVAAIATRLCSSC